MNKKNKKILIVVACIVGGIILFAINIFPYFFETSSSNQQDGDVRVNYNINLDSIRDMGKLKDIGKLSKEQIEQEYEQYYKENLQDALWYGCVFNEDEDKYKRNIDTLIKRIDGYNSILLFYRSIKDNQISSANVCRFDVRERWNKTIRSNMC